MIIQILLSIALTFSNLPVEVLNEIDSPEMAFEVCESDLELLMATVWSEAGNEGLNGQMAVANVILNRVESRYFPNTLQEVVYQGNGRQFNGVWRDSFGYYTEETYEAVMHVLQEPMFSPDITYFANVKLSTDTKFINNVILPYQVEIINRHTFARDRRGF